MKRFLVFPMILIVTLACSTPVERPAGPTQDHGYVRAAVDLMQAVKDGQSTTGLQELLAQADPKKLSEELTNDDLRRTFWINVYNAYIIILLSDDPSLFDDRGDFFKADRITIAGQPLSFDMVEHGILRRSKNKLSLGFLQKVVVPDFEKLFRVDEVDARIHFALNCGAKSCPPVRVYHPGKVNEELDANSRYYLQKATTVEDDDVLTTTLFSWFRADFGDRGGITAYLRRYEAIPPTLEDPSIDFDDYDWTLDIDNFVK